MSGASKKLSDSTREDTTLLLPGYTHSSGFFLPMQEGHGGCLESHLSFPRMQGRQDVFLGGRGSCCLRLQ